MRLRLRSFLVFSFLLAASWGTAQSSIEHIDSLAGRFIKNLRKEYNERIVVQVNKNIFIAGEDVWFKAWVINNLSHKYYKHSQTLYADMVNERDSVVSSVLLNVPAEKTEAKLNWSNKLIEGNYWLRLYTANILKNDPKGILIVPLYLINPKFPSNNNLGTGSFINNKGITTTAINNGVIPQLELFPEGGSIIAGTNAVIGIKAKDSAGNPLSVEGYIADSYDNTIETWFSTNSNGLGKCNFFVSKSRKYTANIKSNNKVLSWPLPAINHFTSQISIKDESPNYLKVVISQGDSIYKKGVATYLLGISRDSLCFASEGKDMYEVSIPKTSFPSGLAKLLLFDDARKVISERNIFIEKGKEELFIATDKEVYSNRDKVIVSLMNVDSLVHPTLAALSVSVTDDHLVSDQLSYYTNAHIETLDTAITVRNNQLLVMPPSYIGQVYSKENELDDEGYKKLVLPVDTTITDIKGRIVNKKNIAMRGRVVTIYSKGKVTLFDSGITDTAGNFNFRLPTLVDSIPITVQVSNAKGAKLDEKIMMETSSPFPVFSTPTSLKTYLNMDQIDQLKRSPLMNEIEIGTGKEWLQSVTVKASIKNNSYNTSKRVSNFSQVITGENLQKIGNNDASVAMLTIPGLHLRSGFVTLGGVTGFTVSAKDEPLLIIDGIMVAGGEGPSVDDGTTMDAGPVFNGSPVLSEISRISTDMIDFIEVLKGPEAAYYGTRSSNGVILINTHRFSNFRNKIERYGSLLFYPKSYHIPSPFVVPEYDNLTVKHGNFKDLRSTIYWNGHLYTNPKGKAEVQFYTGDAKTNYTITVVGLTSSGDLVMKKKKIAVQ